jgi:hypothetical protein
MVSPASNRNWTLQISENAFFNVHKYGCNLLVNVFFEVADGARFVLVDQRGQTGCPLNRSGSRPPVARAAKLFHNLLLVYFFFSDGFKKSRFSSRLLPYVQVPHMLLPS